MGIHISPYRKRFMLDLMEEFEIAYVRGNMDEVASIFTDRLLEKNTLEASLEFDLSLKKALLTHKTVWFISGKRDVILGRGCYQVLEGGNPKLRKITGAGCLLTSLIAVNIAHGIEVYEACIKAGKDLNTISYNLRGLGVGPLRTALIDGLERMGDQYDQKNISHHQ